MSDKRQPWMKWYPRDWRGDGALRMCSFGARGLWADLTGLMHDEGEPYGFLLINGRAPTSAQLARILGGTAKEIEALLAELLAAGVYDLAVEGTIICRRMVRDKQKADADRENGKGGGNPKIKPSVKRGVNPQDNEADKAHIPEATANLSPPNPPQAGGSDASQGSGEEPDRRSPRAKGENPRAVGKAAETRALAEETQAIRDKRRALWSDRLMQYRAGGKWQTTWGAEPWSGNLGCLVPLDMRDEFGSARLEVEQPGFLKSAARPAPDDEAALAARYEELIERRTA